MALRDFGTKALGTQHPKLKIALFKDGSRFFIPEQEVEV